jgi:hypothetical protein
MLAVLTGFVTGNPFSTLDWTKTQPAKDGVR